MLVIIGEGSHQIGHFFQLKILTRYPYPHLEQYTKVFSLNIQTPSVLNPL